MNQKERALMKELIEKMRESARWQMVDGNGDDETHRNLVIGADALERLTAERDTLKQDADRFVVLAEAMIKDNPNLMESFAEHLKTQPETIAQIRAAIDAAIAKDSK